MQHLIEWYTNAISIKSIKNFCILCFWLDLTFFTSNTYTKTTENRYLLTYKYIELVIQVSNIPNNHLFAFLYLCLSFVSLTMYIF